MGALETIFATATSSPVTQRLLTASLEFIVIASIVAIVARLMPQRAVRGHVDPATGQRHRVGDVLRPGGGNVPTPPPGNTTLTLVVVNQTIGLRELRQLARQVHSSMARAIDPFHTIHDGDVLYAVTTNQLESTPLGYHELSYTASELAWDAVLAAVRQ